MLNKNESDLGILKLYIRQLESLSSKYGIFEEALNLDQLDDPKN